jgi:hypothetical protein
MPCSLNPPWLDHSNYTWRRVQIISKHVQVVQLIDRPKTMFPWGSSWELLGCPGICIATVTQVCHWTLFWNISVQFTAPHPVASQDLHAFLCSICGSQKGVSEQYVAFIFRVEEHVTDSRNQLASVRYASHTSNCSALVSSLPLCLVSCTEQTRGFPNTCYVRTCFLVLHNLSLFCLFKANVCSSDLMFSQPPPFQPDMITTFCCIL